MQNRTSEAPEIGAALQDALDHQGRGADDDFAVLVQEVRADQAWAMPVSPSRVTKRLLLAVPGRWRTITEPPKRTRVPEGTSSSAALGSTP